MPYNPDIHSGGEGTVTVNGVDANVTEWSGGEDADLQDCETTGDYDATDKITYRRKKATRRGYKFSFTAYIDGNNYLLGTLRAGSEVGPVVLTMNTGHKVTIATAIISGTPVKTGGTGGLQTFDCNAESQGKYAIS